MGGQIAARELFKLAALIRENHDALYQLETAQYGEPVFKTANFDLPYAAELLEYYGGVGRGLAGMTINAGPMCRALTVREPLGVVGLITPWNFPLVTVLAKVAPALITGNACVVKPPSCAPLTAWIKDYARGIKLLNELEAVSIWFDPHMNLVPALPKADSRRVIYDRIRFYNRNLEGNEYFFKSRKIDDHLRHLLNHDERCFLARALRFGAEHLAKFDQSIKLISKDVKIEKCELEGIPVEWQIVPNTDPDRVLLYLHGGGWILGSPQEHRLLSIFNNGATDPLLSDVGMFWCFTSYLQALRLECRHGVYPFNIYRYPLQSGRRSTLPHKCSSA